MAPHFHVVAKPNDWSRHVSDRARQIAATPLNERQRRYREYWARFLEYLKGQDPNVGSPTPPTEQWWNFAVGRSGFSLTLTAVIRDQRIGAEIYFHDDQDKLIFDHFAGQKTEIEKQFGGALEWERLDGKKGSRVAVRWRSVDPMKTDDWPQYFEWYWRNMQSFRRTFTDRIRELDLDALAVAHAESKMPKLAEAADGSIPGPEADTPT